MNLFRIDFINGKTDDPDYNQIKHSLIDTATDRQILSLTVSSDKLASVSNYSREPKRLLFECFPTTWINTCILAGNNEHERYISKYEVKIYRDTVLFFSGIIDTSQLSFDVASGILKLTCYDKIKLLSVYSDIEHYYGATGGYLPYYILGYFLQDIEAKIPIDIPYSNQCNLPNVHVENIPLSTAEYQDMQVLLPNGGGWVYVFHANSWTAPKWGYKIDNISNTVTFIFAYKKIIQATHTGPASIQYQGKYRGRIYRYYNNICPVIHEYDKRTDWKLALTDLDTEYADFIAFFNEYGILETDLNTLTTTAIQDGNSYGSSHTINVEVSSYFHGNVFPAHLHPGKAYTEYSDEKTPNLKTLQMMLLLYNATIYTDPSGIIIFRNKDNYNSAIIDIADADVISLTTKRGNQERADATVLEILTGDTKQLQTFVTQYLFDFYDAKWEIDTTIDSLTTYSLNLYSKIRIRNIIYAITEVERDYINDEYKIKAWLI